MSTDTMTLNRALAAENLSFPTYALLHAAGENDGPMTVTALAFATGYSYWAVRNQVRRTPWFQNIGKIRHTAVLLTDAGEEKLERVRRRVEEERF